MVTSNNFLNLWKKDWTLKTVLLIIPLFVLTFFHYSVAGYLFAVISFNTFDVFGFNNARDNDDKTAAYRVIQLMMQFVLYGFLYFSCGWHTVVAFAFAHWLCACDRLFYLVQNIALKQEDTFPWLTGWSFFLIYKLFNLPVKRTSFNIVSVLGLIGGLAICLWIK